MHEPVINLPEEERILFVLSNDYRNLRGLSALSDEKRLLDLARRHASALAETICAGDEYSLSEEQWKAVTISAVRKGDLVAIIYIFVSYY